MDEDLTNFEQEIASLEQVKTQTTAPKPKPQAVIERGPNLRLPPTTPTVKFTFNSKNETNKNITGLVDDDHTNDENMEKTLPTTNTSTADGSSGGGAVPHGGPPSVPNQSLLSQQPTPQAQAAGYAPVRGSMGSMIGQPHPYAAPSTEAAAAAATAVHMSRSAAAMTMAARIAQANLAVAAAARQRAGLSSSDLTMKAAAVSAAAVRANAVAAAANERAAVAARRAADTATNSNATSTTNNSNNPTSSSTATLPSNVSTTNTTVDPIPAPTTSKTIVMPNSSLRNYNSVSVGHDAGVHAGRKQKKLVATHHYQLRSAAGDTWVDGTMTDWPENDFRIFCGDLGNEVSDAMLTSAFSKYPSFAKAKVIRDKRTGKSKGYGFVSFLDPNDFIRAFKEMNGKYVGNRPIKLKKSKWKERMKKVKNFRTKQ